MTFAPSSSIVLNKSETDLIAFLHKACQASDPSRAAVCHWMTFLSCRNSTVKHTKRKAKQNKKQLHKQLTKCLNNKINGRKDAFTVM